MLGVGMGITVFTQSYALLTGGGEGLTELAFADFKSGDYRLGADAATVDDLFYQYDEFNVFDPATMIVPGTGLRQVDDGSPIPVLSSMLALSTALFADGFLAICTYVRTQDPPAGASLVFNTVDDPMFNGERTIRFARADGSGLIQSYNDPTYDDDTIIEVNQVSGTHKGAALFLPNALGISIDGLMPTLSTPTPLVSNLLQINLAGNIVVESVGFYSPVSNSALPALSAA